MSYKSDVIEFGVFGEQLHGLFNKEHIIEFLRLDRGTVADGESFLMFVEVWHLFKPGHIFGA